MWQNRKLRVDLATHAGRGTERPSFNDRGGGRYGDRGGEEDDRTAGDWRSGPPPPARYFALISNACKRRV